MITTLVYVTVKPEFINDFKEACRKNHHESIREKGNLRFDILQMSEDPRSFILYEAYIDEASAAAHKLTAHYAEWRNTVKDWMAEPRKGVPYLMLWPQDAESR